MRRVRVATAAVLVLAAIAWATPAIGQNLEVETRRAVRYATHDGVPLAGDLYVPKAPG
jgi:hypothetical protein